MPHSPLGDLIFNTHFGHSIYLNYPVQKWSHSDLNSFYSIQSISTKPKNDFNRPSNSFFLSLDLGLVILNRAVIVLCLYRALREPHVTSPRSIRPFGSERIFKRYGLLSRGREHGWAECNTPCCHLQVIRHFESSPWLVLLLCPLEVWFFLMWLCPITGVVKLQQEQVYR